LEMPSLKHLKGMNKRQRKAVRFGLGKKKLPLALLIIAGAGTGKTRVIAGRVAEASGRYLRAVGHQARSVSLGRNVSFGCREIAPAVWSSDWDPARISNS
jgi:superfamily I DNA/RNA helicase